VLVWNNACLPLKLSVEIVTNLCAAVSGDEDSANGRYCHNDNSHNEDDRINTVTEMLWESERKENIMAQIQQQQQ